MDTVTTMILLLLLLLPLLLPFSLLIFRRKKSGKKLPPSPPTLPFIGNLHQLGSLPHQSLQKLAQKHGPVMLLHLGSVRTVVVSSTDAAKTVLKTRDIDCCSRPPLDGARLVTYDYLDLAFSPYGQYWRDIRKICVLELFSVKRVQSYSSVREDEMAKLISSISDHAMSSSPVDLTEKLFAFSASIVFRIAFGTSFEGSNLHHSRFQEVLLEAGAAFGSFCAAEFFPRVGWIFDKLSGLHGRRAKLFRELDGFYQGIIDAHRRPDRGDQEHEDIIDVLLRLMREKSQLGTGFLTEKNIKAVLFDIFLAGIDTSSITMVWAMTELIKQPELMKKAQDEVRSCIGNKGKTVVQGTDIDQLQYLKMVVKETLRLHSPGPLLLPRETMTTIEVDGYEIPPKTRLQVNAWGIGRDPKYWTDPEKFIPERFVDSSVDVKGQHFEMLPFGSGRRICPGMYMGTTTVELGVANLLYNFDWKLPDGMKEEDINMEEMNGPSVTVSKKTKLSLVPIMMNF